MKIERDIGDDIISAVEDGFLTWKNVSIALIKYMTPEMLKDVIKLNGWNIADDEDFEEGEY